MAGPQIASPPPDEGAGDFLTSDVEIKGMVVLKRSLTIHGRINGEILSSGLLTVGKEGVVDGDIRANAVAVHGVVNGNITVGDRCELRGNAELIGDLDAPRLVIEEGVTFVGNVKVKPHSSDGPQPSKKGGS